MLGRFASLVSALVIVGGAGCSGGANPATASDSGTDSSMAMVADLGMVDAARAPFQAETAAVYVAKVKNILVGLPPTDAEVMMVSADPTALGGLIDGWMALPEYQAKMLVFFELAFQQTQISTADFIDMVPKNGIGNGPAVPSLVQNIRESFARTVLAEVAAGQPLTNAFTTKQLMMTPALMEFYAFLDARRVDDAGNITDDFAAANPKLKIYLGTAQGPIPFADSINPASPNYMHWYSPDIPQLMYPDPGCDVDPIAFGANSYTLHLLLYGGIDNHKVGNSACGARADSAAGVQLAATDFTTWTMVTIRPPAMGEATSKFYDLPSLRAASALVLNTPRPGFFSTPAFFANWATNSSNQMRVTLNQSLIVATGMAIDGTDPTTPATTPGLDSDHSPARSACFGCHQTLDPSRSILAATYSWFYYPQTDPMYVAQKGLFAFQGVIAPVTSIDDFASTLAQHPLLPQAWAEKLCYYVNSAPCGPDDPEFQRIVALFKSSNYSWNALVKALLSSPITTNATETRSWDENGEIIAVSRRDHLCAALNNRLGYIDVCGLDVLSNKAALTAIPEIVGGLPSDGYGRGSPIPVLPNQPTLFYRAGLENICEVVANQVIDAAANPNQPNLKHWSSTQPDAAIADFVSTIMALTASDPRAAPAQALLTSHFTSAKLQANVSAALKSTFVVACLAPSFIGIGM